MPLRNLISIRNRKIRCEAIEKLNFIQNCENLLCSFISRETIDVKYCVPMEHTYAGFCKDLLKVKMKQSWPTFCSKHFMETCS